jgi:hypothetical protein
MHMMESIVSYVFDDIELVRQNLMLITKFESEMRGHFITGFFQTWLAIFHYESFYMDEKRIHRRRARLSHARVDNWSTTVTEMLLGPASFLDAMESLCVTKSSIDNVIHRFQNAASICSVNKCRLFEALADERLSKALHLHEQEGFNHVSYQQQAVELYQNWGGF